VLDFKGLFYQDVLAVAKHVPTIPHKSDEQKLAKTLAIQGKV